MAARKTTGKKAAAARPRHGSRIVIISGLSGSGKTVALRAVEDSGFYCVDNIPVSLISSLIDKISLQGKVRHIAIGIDIREKEFLSGIGPAVAGLRRKFPVEVLFLEAEPEVLVRRFKETRRPHPLDGNLEDAIRTEKKALSELKAGADRVIDTSTLSPHELRSLVTSLYSPRADRADLAVSLISFGFKYGTPQNIDLLFDVRFLPNPHFVPALRDLTGRDRPVSAFVLSQKTTKQFLTKVRDILKFLLPQYRREGRSYISVAFGCTGGRHRSPAIVEEMSRFLAKENTALNVIHRDIS